MQKTRRSGYTMAAVLFYSHFLAIFCGCTLDTPHPKHIILFLDLTSLMSAVTLYVTSQHCTCISHMTFYYKRSTNASVGGSGLWLSHLLEVQRTRLNVPAGDLQRGMWMNWLWYESVHLGLFQTEIIEGWVKPLL